MSSRHGEQTLEHVREALRASEERFRHLIERNADGVLVVGRDGTIRYVNPAAESLLGRHAGELVGEMFGVPVLPGETAEVDVPCGTRPDCVAEMRVVEIDWEGEKCFLASLRDVTERKQTRQALHFLVEASTVLAGTLDFPTTLLSVVRLAVQHLADWCCIDLPDGEHGVRRVAAGHRDTAREGLTAALRGSFRLDRDAGRGPCRVLCSGQPELYTEVPEALLRDLASTPESRDALQALGCKSAMLVPLVARGSTLGCMVLASGESGRRYRDADLALAEDLAYRAALALDNARLYDEAQDAVRRRDEFLAMLAHELRNPLAPILNAAQILRLRGLRDPSLERCRDVIERQSRHMGRLLDDLLDISRVTRGLIELCREPVDLGRLVEQAVQANRPLAEAHGHRLHVDLPRQPLRLDADPTRIEQVVSNLLNNAVKYTDPGGEIRVSAARDGGQAVLRVRDTGAGITAEMLPRIFEPFTQAERTLDRSQGGLGIGLTLVKRLVGLHGGTVEAHSEGPGQGSEFVVRLPLAAVDPGDEPADRDSARRRGRRVLLVEDHRDGRDMLRDLLEMWGHEVTVAEDGLGGLEEFRRRLPDVALIDIGLPGVDGYQVARQVRSLPGGDRVLLVALTGYGQPEDRRRALEAGFNDHLIKPPDLGRLQELLAGAERG